MKKLHLKKNNYLGKLIVFEGTDGAGKTTLISLLEKMLIDKYGEEKVLVLKQPTDLSRKTKLFQKMMYSENHDDINYRAVQLLTMSDRLQHGFEVIEPALKDGKIVICDRYIYTSLVNMEARNYLNEKWFYQVAKHILKPTITFLAYVDPYLAIKRIKDRPEEKNRYLNEKLLINVSKKFYKLAINEKFTILDSKNNPEHTFNQVKEALRKKSVI